MEAPGARLGLCADQIRAGAADAHRRAGLRHGSRGAAALQRLRPGPGALQSLYRRARDLRLAAAQRPASDGLRGWPAAPRFRACRGRRARLPARARASEAPWAMCSTSAAARSRTVEDVAIGSGASDGSRALAPEIAGKARAGDIRHCFADIGKAAQETRLRRRRRISPQGSPNSPNGSRAGRRRPRRSRPAANSKQRTGRMTAAAPSLLSDAPRPRHRRRRLHRLQPRRPARTRRPCRVDLRRARAAGRRGQSRLAEEPHADKISFACRRCPRSDGGKSQRSADCRAVFHLAAQVAVTTSLVEPRDDFDVNVRRHASTCWKRCAVNDPRAPLIFA